MSDVAIRVDNLGKQYRIGARLVRYNTLRESIVQMLSTPFRKLGMHGAEGGADADGPTIWALKDVTFEVKSGEVVGVIGRNGAGKSTLLKILSRITEPTEGCVEIHGRVGSLLEVGTGFHSELTGRENIFLNGAILGMKRAEINRKFDDIVEFAELEKFIDTPVKHYSSGMYMRLAFAVAAHLEPEILLVDEVLAVGDAAFQRKCLGRMGDVAKQGRTVLFVSHNMAAIHRLCPHAMWLNEGRLQLAGSAEDVVAAYMSVGAQTEGERRWEDQGEAPGNDRIRLRAVRILSSAGEVTSKLDVRFPFYVEVEYEVLKPLLGVQVGFWVLTVDGVVVFVAGDNEDSGWLGRMREPGRYKSLCKVPGLLLNAGTYTLTVASDMRNAELLFVQNDILRFEVEPTQFPAHSYTRPAGMICPFLEWRVNKLA